MLKTVDMAKTNANHAKTKRSAIKTLHTAFLILKENGNEMRRKDLIEAITNRVKFEEWELERYKSNNQLKWLTIFLFYTVDCIKAGWLVKNKGMWYLTPEGETAIKLGPEGIFKEAGIAYRKWKSNNQVTNGDDTIGFADIDVDNLDPNNVVLLKVTLEEMEVQANDGLAHYLENMDEYKFQDLCSVLLESMEYYIDFVSPPGRDGGIDIIAFKDPLGFAKPRLKVQVKRYKEKNKVDIDVVKVLKSSLHHGEDIGLIMTSGYFTKDAEKFARESNIHIKLIDRDALIDLWIENYDNLNDDERAMLPLKLIYFLGTNT